MIAAFTPGPWCYTLSLETLPNNGDNFHLGPLGDEYDGPAFTILEGGLVLASDATNIANARLIAAAPELYEALALIIANAALIPDPAMGESTDCYAVPIDDIRSAEAAFRKARGDQ